MNGHPNEPGDRSAEMDSPETGDGSGPADCCEVAFVHVSEVRPGVSVEVASNHLRRISVPARNAWSCLSLTR